MMDGYKACYLFAQTIPSFVELVKVLSHFCRNPDPDDIIAFNSAVCLGRLCVKDDSAKARLIQAMEESQDNHVRAKVRDEGIYTAYGSEDMYIVHIIFHNWLQFMVLLCLWVTDKLCNHIFWGFGSQKCTKSEILF